MQLQERQEWQQQIGLKRHHPYLCRRQYQHMRIRRETPTETTKLLVAETDDVDATMDKQTMTERQERRHGLSVVFVLLTVVRTAILPMRDIVKELTNSKSKRVKGGAKGDSNVRTMRQDRVIGICDKSIEKAI